nr:YitT family protein [Stenotrophomonas sp. MMGLT7]
MIGAALVAAVGIAVFSAGGLMLGGMAGVALLLHYVTGMGFGVLFTLLNLPFYWLAVRRMGWTFTLKTCFGVAACGALADLLPRWASYQQVTPLYSAVVGGMLTGLGILMFIRHRASLGGLNILALFLQERRGWSAGKLQMAFDITLMAIALLAIEPSRVFYSVIGAIVLNMVLLFNHRPGRYTGM